MEEDSHENNYINTINRKQLDAVLKPPEENPEAKKLNEKGFDYSLLKQLIKNQDKKKENVILLSTGSYNPVHRMHLEILNIAYKFISEKLSDKLNVLCAFISPSADCYVQYKMPPLIPFNLRCEMINTAIEEYQKESDLKIFLHTWEGNKDKFIDFPYVIKAIQKELKKDKIKLIYVCGLDLFSKCRPVFKENVIAVDRKPYKNINEYNEKKNIYVVKNEINNFISSTEIRKSYKNKEEENIRKMTFPKVAEMILNFYKKHFII